MNNKYSLFSEKLKNIVAITGGIGCGKSTVLNIFKNLGCSVIDSDQICHELYTKKEFTTTLTKRWGELIITEGKVDKKKVADVVFNDNTQLRWLNSVTHPEIIKYAIGNIESSKNRIILFEMPLLFELKLEKFFRSTIAVWTDVKKQKERLKTRNNWTEEEISLRLRAQLPSETKLEKADYGIINRGSLNLLEIQCNYIFLRIKKEINR